MPLVVSDGKDVSAMILDIQAAQSHSFKEIFKLSESDFYSNYFMYGLYS